MYFEIYNILQTYIYGADAVLTSDMTLTLTMLSTCAVVFLVSLPFALVWRFIKAVG